MEVDDNYDSIPWNTVEEEEDHWKSGSSSEDETGGLRVLDVVSSNSDDGDDDVVEEEVAGGRRDWFPPGFMKQFNRHTRPRTLGTVVDLSDSSDDSSCAADNSDTDTSDSPAAHSCSVPSCSSRRNVLPRSRLVLSYYSLSSVHNPRVCNRCSVKAAKFYAKLTKSTPNKFRFLVNDYKTKPTDCIDICDDAPPSPGDVKMLTDENALEFCKNVSTHVDNVAKKYRIESNFNRVERMMEKKIGNLTVWINELNCKLDMDDDSMVALLQEVYTSFYPPLNQAESLDMDIVDADKPESVDQCEAGSNIRYGSSATSVSSMTTPITVDIDSAPNIQPQEGSGVDEEGGSTKPKDLPPRGLIDRKKPAVGQRVFAKRGDSISDWVPAIVHSIFITNNGEPGLGLDYLYRVKLEGSDTSREVSEENMAYSMVSPVRIPVGCRVISALHPSTDYTSRTTTTTTRIAYYPGVVAECPVSHNKYRYMIMFESMRVQYSHHYELRVVCSMKNKVAMYFPLEHRHFVCRYFDKLPQRKILNVHTMDLLKVERNGEWVDAKVTAVDNLLMEVFYKQGLPTEWLYRGSPRVMTREAFRMRSMKAKIGDMLPIETSRDGSQNNDKADGSVSSKTGGQGAVRAVARKTVTRGPSEQSVVSFGSANRGGLAMAHRGGMSIVRRGGRDEYAGCIRIVKPLEVCSVGPKDFGSGHECSEACVSWINKTLDSCRGRNPLITPMLFGFRRMDVMPVEGGARLILYESPCKVKLEDFDSLLSYLQKTKSQLSVDYFNFDPWVSVWDEFVADPKGIVLKDMSFGKELSMIPVVNTVDKEMPPYLNYKVMRIATEGVPLNLDPGFLTCCDCQDDCSNKMLCACWQKTVKEYLDLIVKNNSERDDREFSYIGYQNKRLVEYVPSGIYECNSMCKCSHTCLNRVVQLPMKVKLELFKTKYKGWGTRCLNDIPAGGFICVYVGNLLTEKAANEDGKTFGDEYFAELDYIEVMERMMNKPGYESGPSDPENTTDEEMDYADEASTSQTTSNDMKLRSQQKEKKKRLKRLTTDHRSIGDAKVTRSVAVAVKSGSGVGAGGGAAQSGGGGEEPGQPRDPANTYVPLRRLYGSDESVYIIDAKSAGNVGRYFNHSCDPNIFVQNVFVDTHDLRFPWVAFFSKHHIRAGTELTWDYQYIVDSVPDKKLYCYCGSKNCRGRLL